MTTVNGIRKLGFKRWYERQLIESHLYLVTCFLCMILVAACLELLNWEEGAQAILVLSLVAMGGYVGLKSWQRFRAIFLNAMRLAETSTCVDCGAYARFSVTGGGPAPAPRVSAPDVPAPPGEWLRVKCRKCGHEWTMT